jgi:hypothetical protein
MADLVGGKINVPIIMVAKQTAALIRGRMSPVNV